MLANLSRLLERHEVAKSLQLPFAREITNRQYLPRIPHLRLPCLFFFISVWVSVMVPLPSTSLLSGPVISYIEPNRKM